VSEERDALIELIGGDNADQLRAALNLADALNDADKQGADFYYHPDGYGWLIEEFHVKPSPSGEWVVVSGD